MGQRKTGGFQQHLCAHTCVHTSMWAHTARPKVPQHSMNSLSNPASRPLPPSRLPAWCPFPHYPNASTIGTTRAEPSENLSPSEGWRSLQGKLLPPIITYLSFHPYHIHTHIFKVIQVTRRRWSDGILTKVSSTFVYSGSGRGRDWPMI